MCQHQKLLMKSKMNNARGSQEYFPERMTTKTIFQSPGHPLHQLRLERPYHQLIPPGQQDGDPMFGTPRSGTFSAQTPLKAQVRPIPLWTTTMLQVLSPSRRKW